MTGLGLIQHESGVAVSIRELPLIVVQLLERAPQQSPEFRGSSACLYGTCGVNRGGGWRSSITQGR